MEFRKVLNEAKLEETFPLYNLNYKSQQKGYVLNDPSPKVLALDQTYNTDGNGESILGLNLNYYDGDIKKLIKQINKFDNKNGFRGFEGKLKLKKFLKQDTGEWESTSRKKRYNDLMKEFPFLKQYVRRYKTKGVSNKKKGKK